MSKESGDEWQKEWDKKSKQEKADWLEQYQSGTTYTSTVQADLPVGGAAAGAKAAANAAGKTLGALGKAFLKGAAKDGLKKGGKAAGMLAGKEAKEKGQKYIDYTRKRNEALRAEEEARQRDQESKEAQKRAEESEKRAKQAEEERKKAERKAEESKKEEDRKSAEEARKKEEDAKRKAEEARQKENEAKRKADEARALAERKRKEKEEAEKNLNIAPDDEGIDRDIPSGGNNQNPMTLGNPVEPHTIPDGKVKKHPILPGNNQNILTTGNPARPFSSPTKPKKVAIGPSGHPPLITILGQNIDNQGVPNSIQEIDFAVQVAFRLFEEVEVQERKLKNSLKSEIDPHSEHGKAIIQMQKYLQSEKLKKLGIEVSE